MLMSQINLRRPFNLGLTQVPAANATGPWQRVRRVFAAMAFAGTSFATGNSSTALLLDGATAGPTAVAVGERGTIIRSTDGGRSWVPMGCPTLTTLTGITFSENNTGWAVGHDAIILHSTDGGITWAKQWQGDLNDSFLDVLAIDATHVIAIGAYGLFISTHNGGASWTRTHIIPADFHLNRVSRGPTGTLYIAGEHGTLLRSTDQGASWVALHTDYQGSFYGILPLDEHALVAYGLRGRVYRSDNDGASWSMLETKRTELLAAAAVSRGTIVLAGNARTVLVSKDHAQSFEPTDVALTGNVAELITLSNGDLIALGEFGAKRIELNGTR
jgi:photosystem II stability/assembly factor-like uncharacterized protein